MTAGVMANRRWRGGSPNHFFRMEEPKVSYKTHKRKIPPGVPESGEDEHPNRTDSRTTTQDKAIMTTTIQCICGRICKNERGLKIHQGRMRCLRAETATQCTEATSGKTQEEPGPEATHSAQSLLVSLTPAASSSPATITQETASLDNPQGLQSCSHNNWLCPFGPAKDPVIQILQES